MSKKTKYSFFVGSLLILSLLGTNMVQSFSEPIIPEVATIISKSHLEEINKLEYSNEEERARKINNYLMNLSTKEVLETAAEHSVYVKKNGDDPYFYVFTPHLRERWKNGVPFEDISKIIKNQTYDKDFRVFVLDMGLLFNDQYGKINKKLSSTLREVAQNPSDELRAYALKRLDQPGDYKDEKGNPILKEIFLNEDTLGKVRGAALTSMRRTQDPYLKEAISTVLKNPSNYSDIEVRHAVVGAAKAGFHTELFNEMKSVAVNAENRHVYSSAIYGLGLTKTPEAVKVVVENYGKYDNPSIGYVALLKNKKAILSLLDVDQPEDSISAGLRAAKEIKYEDFITPLENLLLEDSLSNTVKKGVKETLEVIKANPQKSNPKWEVD